MNEAMIAGLMAWSIEIAITLGILKLLKWEELKVYKRRTR